MTAATIVMAVYTVKLWSVSNSQRVTLEEATATSQNLERARFGIDERELSRTDKMGVVVRYALLNRGRSPEMLVREAANIYWGPKLPQPPVFPEWETCSDVVQAGDSFIKEMTVHGVTPEQKIKIDAGEFKLHVVGRVEYRDVFDKHRIRAYAFTYDGVSTFQLPEDANGYNFET